MKKLNRLLALGLLMAAAAPASAGLIGDSVTIKRVQGGTVIFKTVNANVGAAVEYTDNFFNIDISENEILFDAIGNFSVGDVVYTIEGLDFDDKPATANTIENFATNQIFGNGVTPFDVSRAKIGTDGKFSLSFNQTTGSSSGFARVTLGAASPAAVPEPAAWALMIAGFGLVGSAARTRTGRKAVLA